MPNILLELLCEEIPARMQVAAMEHLKKAITNGLVDAGLTYEGAQAFVTPRRLALHVVNVPIATKPQIIERKGPRVGAPDGAIQGFLKASGLTSIDQAELQDDGKGGQFYIAKQHKEGRPTAEVLQELVRKTVLEFPWPKSMRWGSGTLNWVRPLHNICCTLSSETDVEVIDCSIENVTGKAETRGHTFLAPAPFAVKRFEDYVEELEKHFVVLDRERRKQIILADARTMAFAQGLELVEDQGLLEEIAGLVEWPVVLMGSFDEAFLSIPERVIQTTIRVNQKCFVLKQTPSLRGNEAQRNDDLSAVALAKGEAIQNSDSQKETGLPRSLTLPRNDGTLANKFLLVSNLQATDGGAAIIAGNERVIRARLSDAKFFWENDQKIKLEDRLEGLNHVVFHEKLGTQWDRVKRIKAIASRIMQDLSNVAWVSGDNEAERIAAEKLTKLENTKLAARLAKADLLTEMVGEFPELQGYIGRKYAEKEGLPESVCIAIEDHYKPRGPGEAVPTDEIAIAVALAEKIDILVSFWKIDEKPTGSKDPYALRRAALGIIRIMMEHPEKASWPFHLMLSQSDDYKAFSPEKMGDILDFFSDRLRVQLIDRGYPHDIVDAVHSRKLDCKTAVERIESFITFLKTEAGKNLLLGFRRANNILKAEEKKDGADTFTQLPDLSVLSVLEASLNKQIGELEIKMSLSVNGGDFVILLTPLSEVSKQIHTYIENTMINDPDPDIRLNRLRLLAYYRRLTRTVADFEKIEG